MPRKPARPCSHPGCPELVTTGSRCEGHRKAQFKQKTAAAMRDARKREDKSFYDSALWRNVRVAVVMKEPWCRECARYKRASLAAVVDHIVPLSMGGPKLDTSNLQPLCHPCHNRKRRQEMRAEMGETRVHVVCGPPGSGKSTWVRERAGEDDLVVDLDLLITALSVRGYAGGDIHERPASHVGYAVAARDAVLSLLAIRSDVAAWIITSGASAVDRRDLRERFKADVVVLEVSTDECVGRLSKDAGRSHQAERMRPVVERWWREYEPEVGDRVVRAA